MYRHRAYAQVVYGHFNEFLKAVNPGSWHARRSFPRSTSEMTATGDSGIDGGRMRSIGLALTSPSSTHQRQNNRSDRKRVAAVAGLCVAS